MKSGRNSHQALETFLFPHSVQFQSSYPWETPPKWWRWSSLCPGGRAQVMHSQEDTDKGYRKGKIGEKKPKYLGGATSGKGGGM